MMKQDIERARSMAISIPRHKTSARDYLEFLAAWLKKPKQTEIGRAHV